jgi:UPF0271 protein
MATAGEVETHDGAVIGCVVESICLHGDTPGAVELAGRVRQALLDAGVPVRPFAPAAGPPPG